MIAASRYAPTISVRATRSACDLFPFSEPRSRRATSRGFKPRITPTVSSRLTVAATSAGSVASSVPARPSRSVWRSTCNAASAGRRATTSPAFKPAFASCTRISESASIEPCFTDSRAASSIRCAAASVNVSTSSRISRSARMIARCDRARLSGSIPAAFSAATACTS